MGGTSDPLTRVLVTLVTDLLGLTIGQVAAAILRLGTATTAQVAARSGLGHKLSARGLAVLARLDAKVYLFKVKS